MMECLTSSPLSPPPPGLFTAEPTPDPDSPSRTNATSIRPSSVPDHEMKNGPLLVNNTLPLDAASSPMDTIDPHSSPVKGTAPVIDHEEDELNRETALSATAKTIGVTLNNAINSKSKPNPAESVSQNPPRPSRNRFAPTRLDEEIQISRSPQPASNSSLKRKQPLRGNWSINYLMTNPRSKLATVNLSELLSMDLAWTALSREEQLELLSLLPGASASASDMPTDKPLPNIAKASLKSNSSLQADLRLFQEDLAAGRYDLKWIEDAQLASKKRACGQFDSWKEKHKESFWGQKQRIDWNARAGDSSMHDLTTLVAAGYFAVGDIWLLQRGYRPGNGEKGCFVEKETKIKAISVDHKLTFTYPPGQAKFSAPAAGDDIEISDVDGPIKLSNAVLDEDRRIVGIRGANSWKEFRCIRKNQDMGSLWDVRELYHSRQS